MLHGANAMLSRSSWGQDAPRAQLAKSAPTMPPVWISGPSLPAIRPPPMLNVTAMSLHQRVRKCSRPALVRLVVRVILRQSRADAVRHDPMARQATDAPAVGRQTVFSEP